MTRVTAIVLLTTVAAIGTLEPISAQSDDAFQLYQDVMSGQREFDGLTQEQQWQVLQVHKMLSRDQCEGCSDDCRDARDRAGSYRDDLEGYTRKLYKCIERIDLTDDCYREFRRVKSSHSDFESAVSEVGSYCD